jgi:hypothetical protein
MLDHYVGLFVRVLSALVTGTKPLRLQFSFLSRAETCCFGAASPRLRRLLGNNPNLEDNPQHRFLGQPRYGQVSV